MTFAKEALLNKIPAITELGRDILSSFDKAETSLTKAIDERKIDDFHFYYGMMSAFKKSLDIFVQTWVNELQAACETFDEFYKASKQFNFFYDEYSTATLQGRLDAALSKIHNNKLASQYRWEKIKEYENQAKEQIKRRAQELDIDFFTERI